MAQTDRTPQSAVPELSGFQRDLLFVIASVAPSKGTALKDELQDYYATEINHGRLYPNLDTLVTKGLVEKGQRDQRTNEYTLTPRGEQILVSRRDWEHERLSEVDA